MSFQNRNASTLCIFFIFFSTVEFLWKYLLCFFSMTFQEGSVCPSEPAFCLNIPHFPVSFFIMAWAEHSPHWFPFDLDLASAWWAANSEQLPGCFVRVGRLFLFSFALLEGLSAAFCNFVQPNFWGMGSVPGLCGQGGHQVLLWLVNLHVQVAAAHSAAHLQDSSAAALLFCPERTTQRASLENKIKVASNPCPFWI